MSLHQTDAKASYSFYCGEPPALDRHLGIRQVLSSKKSNVILAQNQRNFTLVLRILSITPSNACMPAMWNFIVNLRTISAYIVPGGLKHEIILIFFSCISAEHSIPETVILRILLFQHGGYRILATGTFTYMLDPVRPLAEFLLGSIYDPTYLENMDRIQDDYPAAFDLELTQLDERLTQELIRMRIPSGWNMMGVDDVSTGKSRCFDWMNL